MKRKGTAVTAVALAVGFALAAGCGGGGGGGGGHTRTTQFTAENADQAMAMVTANTMACTSTSVAKTSSLSAEKSLAFARTLPRQLFAFNELINSDGSDSNPGDCSANSAGSVSVSYDHSSGSTTFSFTFTNYCKKGDSNDRETIFNGTAQAKQNGTPSGSGPIYKGMDVKTTGSDLNAKTYDVSAPRVGPSVIGPVGTLVTDYKVEIGNYSIDFDPQKWQPYYPDPATQADPDVDVISSLTITDNVSGDRVRVEDVRIESWDNDGVFGGSTTASVESGWVSGTNLGTFSVATNPAAPLVVNEFGEVESGEIIASGAKGTSVTLTAVDNSFTAVVDDGTDITAVPTGFQCDYIARWPVGLLGFTETGP